MRAHIYREELFVLIADETDTANETADISEEDWLVILEARKWQDAAREVLHRYYYCQTRGEDT